MSYEFYKVLHLVGLFLVFGGLSGLFMMSYSSGVSAISAPARRLAALSHGIGLLFVLVSGFGLAARLGYMAGLPNWVYVKIALWLTAGGMLVVAKKLAHKGVLIYLAILSIGFAGAFLAVTKPF